MSKKSQDEFEKKGDTTCDGHAGVEGRSLLIAAGVADGSCFWKVAADSS